MSAEFAVVVRVADTNGRVAVSIHGRCVTYEAAVAACHKVARRVGRHLGLKFTLTEAGAGCVGEFATISVRPQPIESTINESVTAFIRQTLNPAKLEQMVADQAVTS